MGKGVHSDLNMIANQYDYYNWDDYLKCNIQYFAFHCVDHQMGKS